jgi:thioredoxin 2
MTAVMTSRVVKCQGCGKPNRAPAIALGRPGCGNCNRALPWIVEADDTTFSNVVVADLVVLVELWASWCRPSQLVSPIVERVANDYAGRVKVVRVDADRAPLLQAQLKLQGMPMLLFMWQGKVLDSMFGAQPEATVRQHLDECLNQRR